MLRGFEDVNEGTSSQLGYLKRRAQPSLWPEGLGGLGAASRKRKNRRRGHRETDTLSGEKVFQKSPVLSGAVKNRESDLRKRWKVVCPSLLAGSDCCLLSSGSFHVSRTTNFPRRSLREMLPMEGSFKLKPGSRGHESEKYCYKRAGRRLSDETWVGEKKKRDWVRRSDGEVRWSVLGPFPIDLPLIVGFVE